MSIIAVYDVTCNICDKDFPENGQVGDMASVERAAWLVLYDSDGRNPYAAVCPTCWDQIVEAWDMLGDNRQRGGSV